MCVYLPLLVRTHIHENRLEWFQNLIHRLPQVEESEPVTGVTTIMGEVRVRGGASRSIHGSETTNPHLSHSENKSAVSMSNSLPDSKDDILLVVYQSCLLTLTSIYLAAIQGILTSRE
jgi:hypothetical protein